MVCISCGVSSSKSLCSFCEANVQQEAERKAAMEKEIQAQMQKGFDLFVSMSGIHPMQVLVASIATQCLRANPVASAEDCVAMAKSIINLSK